MNNSRTVLSDADHLSLSLYSADMLLAGRRKMAQLEKLYEREELPFPIQCRTNLRDAWFHYKKVYERFDSIKVYQEQYAMEEHLVRMIKDAITVLFNVYAYRIENAYYLLDEKQAVLDVLKSTKSEDCYCKCADIRIDTDHWFDTIRERISGEKETRTDAVVKDVTLCLFMEQADIDVYRKVLQQCMHIIKNYSLKTRLEGIEIYRPENSDHYLDDFAEVFGKVKRILENHRIFSVLPQFSSFYTSCSNDKCKICERGKQKASVISCSELKCENRLWKARSELYTEE